MDVSGVRNSWETLAMKSRRVFSMRSVSVRSRSTATTPPPGMGAAVMSKVRPAVMVFDRADGKHSILHAVEKGLKFALAGFEAREALFHAARRFVERGRDLPNFIAG